MKSLRRRARSPLAGLALALIIGSVAACAGAGAPTSGSAATSTTEPSTAPTLAPTDMLVTTIDLLPTASFDPSMISVACDEATLGASASMSCDDIVAATVRIATTMSKNPVTQVSVTKPADNPNGIQVTFWVQAEDASGLTAFTSEIDPANGTFTFPVEDSEAVFPTAS